MTSQLDLFAGPVERIAIELTREVIFQGVGAKGVPDHEHVPAKRPKPLRSDDEWLAVLRVAEKEIRWRFWTRPRLELDEKCRCCKGCWKCSRSQQRLGDRCRTGARSDPPARRLRRVKEQSQDKDRPERSFALGHNQQGRQRNQEEAPLAG